MLLSSVGIIKYTIGKQREGKGSVNMEKAIEGFGAHIVSEVIPDKAGKQNRQHGEQNEIRRNGQLKNPYSKKSERIGNVR